MEEAEEGAARLDIEWNGTPCGAPAAAAAARRSAEEFELRGSITESEREWCMMWWGLLLAVVESLMMLLLRRLEFGDMLLW